MEIGQHAAPVKDVYAFPNPQNQMQLIICSGGFDAKVMFWAMNGQQFQKINEVTLVSPVQYMSGSYPLLVTAHSENKCFTFNLQQVANNVVNPQPCDTAQLKTPFCAMRCFADGKGFAIASIEGRCLIKYVNTPGFAGPSTNQADFTFKLHRVEPAQG